MSFTAIAALIDNPLTHPDGRDFCAILGANPSKGARSPLLWNAAFVAHSVDMTMLPLDVTSERLPALLEALQNNRHFLGGAIAVPHKEAVARWLDGRLADPAQSIGAVNCLFRGADARLWGTNTDGEGALASFVERFGSLAGKRVLQLGVGGSGKAVAAFFRSALGERGRLLLSSRSDAAERAAAVLNARAVPWSGLEQVLGDVDVLVNCTSVGSGSQIDAMPLSEAQLAKLSPHAVVFDIVYQPAPTLLLSKAQARGHAILDGTGMNLEQAVIAFGRVAPAPRGPATTRAAMEAAKRT